MSKAYILTEKEHRLEDDNKWHVYTNVIGVYTDISKLVTDARSRTSELDEVFSNIKDTDLFVWTFCDTFCAGDLREGVLVISIGSHRTDSIVQYHVLSLQEGDIK